MKTVAPSSQQTLQRVKVGMIGLAAVVLLIGIASAIFSTAKRERPIAVAGTPTAEAVANLAITNGVAPVDPANEPLAELGVAPSTVESNVASPAQINATQ